jgi:hypothetical protein
VKSGRKEDQKAGFEDGTTFGYTGERNMAIVALGRNVGGDGGGMEERVVRWQHQSCGMFVAAVHAHGCLGNGLGDFPLSLSSAALNGPSSSGTVAWAPLVFALCVPTGRDDHR